MTKQERDKLREMAAIFNMEQVITALDYIESLEKAILFALDDDGLIPRATSNCRNVLRNALSE